MVSMVTLVTTWLAATSGARAFSDPAVFAQPAFEGGGGGRYFTGSPRDGLSCSVCHSGAEAPHVEILGLPRVLVAGQTRDVLIRWPAAAGSHALQLELMSRDGANAGLELLEPDVLPAASHCDERLDAEPAAFAVDVGERRVLGVSDCGASELRFRFTTPDVQELFFSIGVVRSDGSGTSAGDGVFEWRKRIGVDPIETELTAGCSALGPTRGGPLGGLALALVLCLLSWRMWRARCRSRRQRASRYAMSLVSSWALLGCVAGAERGDVREAERDAALPYIDEFTALLDAGAARRGVDGGHACEPDPSPLSQLRFRVRTVSGEGRYRPRNVGAIWLEDADQHWVRTLARWGKQRAKWLTEFNAASGGDVTDAITTATLPSHEVHELEWDLRDAAGCEVANGQYALRVEVTDWSGTGENIRIELDKDEQPVAFEPPDEATFRDMSVTLE